MTTLQKALNVYSICSLYASVQGIDDSPFLPHRAVLGVRLCYTAKEYNALGCTLLQPGQHEIIFGVSP